jgi:hypothetical protein
MKITAEFNSNEELLSFISAFGAKSFKSDNTAGIINVPIKEVETVKDVKKEDKPKDSTPIVDAEVVSQETPTGKVVDADISSGHKEDSKEEDPKVTKEMIREKLGAIMKAGKQKEAKDLLSKYFASKLPELKEEHYAAVYEEAEGLL